MRSIICALLFVLPFVSWAHKPSDSYLSLDLDGQTLQGQWAIALQDLHFALDLDSNQDQQITWGELRQQQPLIANYALKHLQITADKTTCTLATGTALLDDYSDGVYLVLPLQSDCPTEQALTLDYQLFFALDAWHRGLLKVQHRNQTQTAVLSPQQPSVGLNQGTISVWQTFSNYWQEGVWHIWIGFDHILFLLALLLPSVVWRNKSRSGHWQYAQSFGQALRNIAAIVTAFTLAHSITLAAAVLGWVNLPIQWVEVCIALTVLFAALNNLWPVVTRRPYLLAFVLGLIHGLGFANVLTDLGLPDTALIQALLAFNLGVESGQLAIVLVFVPLAYLLRHTWLYRRMVLQLGSLLIATLSFVWFWQRSFVY